MIEGERGERLLSSFSHVTLSEIAFPLLLIGDITGDGSLDIVTKPWGVKSWSGVGGKMRVDFLDNRSRQD